jgi:hypothetical protein
MPCVLRKLRTRDCVHPFSRPSQTEAEIGGAPAYSKAETPPKVRKGFWRSTGCQTSRTVRSSTKPSRPTKLATAIKEELSTTCGKTRKQVRFISSRILRNIDDQSHREWHTLGSCTVSLDVHFLRFANHGLRGKSSPRALRWPHSLILPSRSLRISTKRQRMIEFSAACELYSPTAWEKAQASFSVTIQIS